MTRFASMIALAAFLTFGLGTVASFANEPAPAEQKDRKDQSGTKAEPASGEQKEKKDQAGTKSDGDRKDEQKQSGGK